MKANILVGCATLAGLTLMLTGSVTAASADTPRGDRCNDRTDIRHDVRDIRHDRVDIHLDQRQIGRLDGRLTYDVNHGRFGAATNIAYRINADRHDVALDRADVRHDLRDVRSDRADLRHDRGW